MTGDRVTRLEARFGATPTLNPAVRALAEMRLGRPPTVEEARDLARRYPTYGAVLAEVEEAARRKRSSK